MAWLDGYNRRIELIIDHTQIDTGLVDFPMLIDVEEAQFFSDMLPTDGEYSDEVFDDVGGLYGDEFPGSLEEPNADLWYRPSGYSSQSLRVESNRLEYSQSSGSGSLLISKLEGLFKLAGDFDIQADFELFITNTPSSGMSTASFIIQDSVNGNRASVGAGVRTSADQKRWYMNDTVSGYTDYSAQTKPAVLKHRIVRVGSVIKGYIWDTDTNEWVWNGNTNGYTFGITGTNDMLVRFEISVPHTFLNFGVAWDNFKINSGTVTWASMALPTANLFQKYIAVTGSDGETEQYVELDYVDMGSDDCFLHTKVPIVSAGDDTYLYLYWDSTHAVGDNPMVGETGEAAAQNVWDDDYYGVWHINDLVLKDSTANGNNFTPTNMAADDFQVTHPGKGANFNGINEYLRRNVSFNNYPITMEGYGIVAGNPVGQVTPTVSIGDTGQFYRQFTISLYQNEARLIQQASLTDSDNITTTGRNWQVGDFAGLAGVIESNTSRHIIGDGVEKVVGTDSVAFPPSVDKLYVGATVSSEPGEQDGLTSEVRVSLIVRSDAWLKATYSALAGNLFGAGSVSPLIKSSQDIAWYQKTPLKFERDISWYLGPGDLYFNVDPNLRVPGIGDIFQNNWDGTGGGDRWFDVLCDNNTDTTWAILNKFLRDIAWDILNANDQDTAWDILNAFAQSLAWDIVTHRSSDVAWSVFAEFVYFVQQFFIKAICYEFGIKYPVPYSKQIFKPVQYIFETDSVLVDTVHMASPVDVTRTFNIKDVVQFDFQIKEPLVFLFGVDKVLQGFSKVKQLKE